MAMAQFLSLAARLMLMFAGAAALAACTVGPEETPAPTSPTTTDGAATATSPMETTPGTTVGGPTLSVTSPSAEFDASRAFDIVQYLAREIGPREAASERYHEAADYVVSEFNALGYQATTTSVPVPAGDSWGVPVDAGESANVVADTPGLDPAQPHVLIGAHLDTVAVAPGAEDNASGVGVLIELARLVQLEPPDVPVRFVAFGAEEPRGDGDDLHHFGSQQYVSELSQSQRDAIVGMVSLDRVGVAAEILPVCTGGNGPIAVRDELLAAASRATVAAEPCENRSSDHWSFEKAGIASARLGSVPYAEYHSESDLPEVVSANQLDRAGQVVWSWLSELGS